MAKFGKNIELTGTAEFRSKVVDLAIEERRNINFLDDWSRQYYNSCMAHTKSIISQNNREANTYSISQKPSTVFKAIVQNDSDIDYSR